MNKLSEQCAQREVCKTVQAPSGVCRFCGCTYGNACKLGDGTTCAWRDNRHTICSNPVCQLHYRALTRPALEALVSGTCICGRVKSHKMAFCSACWHLLPWTIASLLYEPMARGFACYYNEAAEALKRIEAAKGAAR